MSDNAVGLRGSIARLEQLDGQGRRHPRPTVPASFLADLDKLNSALAPWLLTEDGEPIGYSPDAPAALLDPYQGLVSYGYAQGWL